VRTIQGLVSCHYELVRTRSASWLTRFRFRRKVEISPKLHVLRELLCNENNYYSEQPSLVHCGCLSPRFHSRAEEEDGDRDLGSWQASFAWRELIF
jgi:hypothetical protein